MPRRPSDIYVLSRQEILLLSLYALKSVHDQCLYINRKIVQERISNNSAIGFNSFYARSAITFVLVEGRGVRFVEFSTRCDFGHPLHKRNQKSPSLSGGSDFFAPVKLINFTSRRLEYRLCRLLKPICALEFAVCVLRIFIQVCRVLTFEIAQLLILFVIYLYTAAHRRT